MKYATLVLLVIVLSGCLPMSDDRATRAVEHAGISDVTIEGVAFFGCDVKYTFRSKFTGKDAKGRPVSGVVCGGGYRGATVRFD